MELKSEMDHPGAILGRAGSGHVSKKGKGAEVAKGTQRWVGALIMINGTGVSITQPSVPDITSRILLSPPLVAIRSGDIYASGVASVQKRHKVVGGQTQDHSCVHMCFPRSEGTLVWIRAVTPGTQRPTHLVVCACLCVLGHACWGQ